MARPRIVLIGAGHAHMEAARQAARFLEAGCDLTLIDPDRFWYSGAATGYLAGALTEAAVIADPKPLIEAGGGGFIRARAEHIDRAARRVHLSNGERLAYDVVSLNTGSAVSVHRLPGAENALPVKPIANLREVRARLEANGGPRRIAVIGGGATGCEIALNLAALGRRQGAQLSITVIDPDPLPIRGWPKGARKAMQRALQAAGIAWAWRGGGAGAIADGAVELLKGGQRLKADLVLLATGLVGHSPEGVLQSPGGDIQINPHLQTAQDARLFAAGDVIELARGRQARPKLGVFGVRAAPILIDNLIAAATGGRMRRYRPQRLWLSIMDLGDGTGLARYGPLWRRGTSMLALKRRIDAAFIARYQTPP